MIRTYLLPALLLLSLRTAAQTADTRYDVRLINPTNLAQMPVTMHSCVLAKVWIPNCATAEQQFKEFAAFEKSVNYPVIFIGITNDPKKITAIAEKNGYRGTLYMLDTTLDANIYKRFEVFKKGASEQVKTGTEDFDTLMLDEHGKSLWAKEVLGFPASLKKKC